MGLGVAVRLAEWPAWRASGLYVDGLPLLPSIDAYGWLAGAQCVGRLAGQPLSLLLGGLVWLTGLPVDSIALWLPALLAPLAAWPLMLLCRDLGLPEAGLGAGVLSVLTPAYLYRTRLGFCDTDMLVLPLVCLAVWVLAAWVRLPPAGQDAGDGRGAGRTGPGLRAGAALALLVWLYPSGQPLAVGMALTAVLARGWRRRLALTAEEGVDLLLVVLPAFLGPAGLGLGLLAMGLTRLPVRCPANLRRFVAVGLGLALLAGLVWALPAFSTRLGRQLAFFAHLSPMAPDGSLSPANSVLEASIPAWQETLRQLAFHWGLALAAGLGYGLALWVLPGLWPSFPVVLLAFFSLRLGIRFAMYGSLVAALGLAVPLALAGRRFSLGPGWRWCLQGGLVLLVLPLVLAESRTLRPVPVLSAPHAAALRELGRIAPADAQVWTWWDFGYATEHFAHVRTFSDAGNNAGDTLYLQSVALAATDPAVAAGAIRLAATLQRDAPPVPRPLFVCPGSVLANGPLPLLRTTVPGLVAGLPGSLAGVVGQEASDRPAQYVVVPWALLRLGRWPVAFAGWTPDGGTPAPGMWPLSAPMARRINIDLGWVELEGKRLPLVELDVFTSSGKVLHRQWPRGRGLAAALNLANAELVLFDRATRQSMLARLLLDAPESLPDEFELVVDRTPWVRIYKVRQAAPASR